MTFPRIFGYGFIPVSFWFAKDDSSKVIAVIAEVNNTFGSHDNYVIHENGEPIRYDFSYLKKKILHVSPFKWSKSIPYEGKIFLKILENLEECVISLFTPDDRKIIFKGRKPGLEVDFYLNDWKAVKLLLMKGDNRVFRNL